MKSNKLFLFMGVFFGIVGSLAVASVIGYVILAIIKYGLRGCYVFPLLQITCAFPIFSMFTLSIVSNILFVAKEKRKTNKECAQSEKLMEKSLLYLMVGFVMILIALTAHYLVVLNNEYTNAYITYEQTCFILFASLIVSALILIFSTTTAMKSAFVMRKRND